ncbi:hypothetical protein EI555_006368 [Monodon monoceros]|uniref:Uncharacterized protein n=1 Tax=Monodon monoceros TaxID=40151 RepID=A0A4U1EEJ2_MONMO|nr:hypothetical protein EI555_006368 [Monodon monoceros]
MVRRLLITVRIRRAYGPPRVRAFVVQIARPAREWAAPVVRAAADLVLMLVRSQRRAQQPHPRPGINQFSGMKVIFKSIDYMKSPIFSKYLKTEHMT